MKKTSFFLILLISIIIMILCVLVVTGKIGYGGNQVTIKGTLYYDMINGWGVTYNTYTSKPDNSFLTINPMWYWPWQTKDVNIKVELTGLDKKYDADIWIGPISNIISSQNFNVIFRHIPNNSYSGTIYVYEVEKNLIGFESSRSLKATCGGWNINI